MAGFVERPHQAYLPFQYSTMWPSPSAISMLPKGRTFVSLTL